MTEEPGIAWAVRRAPRWLIIIGKPARNVGFILVFRRGLLVASGVAANCRAFEVRSVFCLPYEISDRAEAWQRMTWH